MWQFFPNELEFQEYHISFVTAPVNNLRISSFITGLKNKAH